MKDSLFHQLRNRWSSFIQEPTEDQFNVDIFTKFPFLKYIESENVAYSILNNVSFEIEHHSRNFFDVLGLSKIDFEKYGTSTFIEAVVHSQTNYFSVLPKYFKDYWMDTPEDKRKDIIRKTIGLSFKHNDKGIIRLIVQTYILDVNTLNAPTYLFVTYHDVTYMLKDDFYWIRYTCVDKSIKPLVYHDGQKEVLKDDIISVREKEILKLIIDGKTTDEIADSLFISRVTVNNHRQNMLNRVGAKDTTALITLARICQLI